MATTLASPRYVLLLAIIAFISLSLVMFIWMSTIPTDASPVLKKYDHHGEKFIAYLPHSGLSNQRTELENALLLASYLNRTLIVPPAFLGKMQGWHNGDSMNQNLNDKTEPQPWWYQCHDKRASSHGPCNARSNYLSVPWDFLHESMAKLDVPMRHIQHISMENIQKWLTLDDDEVYNYQDTSVYSWKVCDRPKSKCPPGYDGKGHQYDTQWTVDDLRKVSHPLIQLQGIFGANRIGVSGREHVNTRSKIRTALSYKNPLLDAVTENIVNELGGKHKFLAIHVRMGDWQFLGGLRKNLGINIQFLENELAKMGCNQTSTTQCPNPPKIYLATDAKNPRKNANLAPLFERFPRTAIINDFQHLLTPLEKAMEIAQPPQKSVIRFMIPIIDAMVPANAKAFNGTNGSTYSKYIERLHKVYKPSKYVAAP
ncbi:hypothetical protein NQZ79_g912 [Umbelopsis isabellina]|nr:hypothetical protein NQZ79_g912 [Umbelopsis isabellina]